MPPKPQPSDAPGSSYSFLSIPRRNASTFSEASTAATPSYRRNLTLHIPNSYPRSPRPKSSSTSATPLHEEPETYDEDEDLGSTSEDEAEEAVEQQQQQQRQARDVENGNREEARPRRSCHEIAHQAMPPFLRVRQCSTSMTRDFCGECGCGASIRICQI